MLYRLKVATSYL